MKAKLIAAALTVAALHSAAPDAKANDFEQMLNQMIWQSQMNQQGYYRPYQYRPYRTPYIHSGNVLQQLRTGGIDLGGGLRITPGRPLPLTQQDIRRMFGNPYSD